MDEAAARRDDPRTSGANDGTRPRSDVERVQELAAAKRAIEGELGKRIVGQKDVIDLLLIALFARGHGLFVGVPGLAKTLLIQSLAEVLSLRFGRIQFTPDLMPSDITGTDVLEEDPETGRRVFRFVAGPVFTNILLADEINRTPPKTQAALLQAMAEGRVTAGGRTHALETPYLVFATQNPIEQEGTYPLPEAQLDRFLFKLQVGFPTRDELHSILDRTTGNETPAVTPVLDRDGILQMRKVVRDVAVAHHVKDYAIRVLEATHPDRTSAPEKVKRFVRFGASPRGAQAMLLAAKIRALMDGRFAAAIDDVRWAAKPALRHRVILNFEGEAEGVRGDDVLDEILRTVKETG